MKYGKEKGPRETLQDSPWPGEKKNPPIREVRQILTITWKQDKQLKPKQHYQKQRATHQTKTHPSALLLDRNTNQRPNKRLQERSTIISIIAKILDYPKTLDNL